MVRKKKKKSINKGKPYPTKQDNKFNTSFPIVLYVIDKKWISEPDDTLNAFRLSLSESDRALWEMLATVCLEINWWNPPLFVGSIGWEEDARKEQESYVAFLRRKKNQYQLFMDAALCELLALEEINSSNVSVTWNDTSDSYFQIPGESLLPMWHLEIAEIVKNLQEGKEVGLYVEQKGVPDPIFTIFYDMVSQSWWSQFCWKFLLRDLLVKRFDGTKWTLLLPKKILFSLPTSLKEDLLHLSPNRWKGVSLIIGVKVIGIDNVLICAISEEGIHDPLKNEVFQISWLMVERHLNEECPSGYQLSVKDSDSLKIVSRYINLELCKFIKIVLAQAPKHLTIVLEKAVSLDFGVFQEEANLRYDISTKKKLGELILEEIDRGIASISDSRIFVEWVDSSGAYEVCSVCGLPYDGSCPHFPRHRIEDLDSSSTAVDIAFEVLRKISEEAVKNQRLKTHHVAEFLVGDETGQVVLSVWDDDIEFIEVGKAYLLKGGKTKIFRSSLRLVRGKGTFLPLQEMVWLPKNNENSPLT